MNTCREEYLPQPYPNRKRVLPWLIVFVLAVTIVSLTLSLRSYRQTREQMQQQLERQNLIIDSLEQNQKETAPSRSIPVITSDTLKRQLNALSELVTQEYIYTNADQRTDDVKWLFGWTRPFSESSLLITYDGTIKAGINMSEVQVEIDEESRTVTVTLPASEIMENIIPQESINVVEVKNGLFNEITFDDYNTFISEQKIVMEQKAIENGILTRADAEARQILETFLTLLPEMSGEDAYTLILQ